MKNTLAEQLHHPSTGINFHPSNAKELAAWLGENDHQSDYPLLYREIISEEFKLAMMDLAMERELMSYSDPAEINVNLGLIRFFNRFGCRCIDTGIVHSRGTKVGKLELPDGSFVEIALTPEIDLSETAAAKTARAGQLSVAQRRHASHDERVSAIAETMETTLFKYCYERDDLKIVTFVIVAPNTQLATVVACYLEEGETALKQLEVEGKLKITPSFMVFQDFYNEHAMNPQLEGMVEYLTALLPKEVHAFYAPPYYFVQLTTPR